MLLFFGLFVLAEGFFSDSSAAVFFIYVVFFELVILFDVYCNLMTSMSCSLCRCLSYSSHGGCWLASSSRFAITLSCTFGSCGCLSMLFFFSSHMFYGSKFASAERESCWLGVI